jgi:hypothetical protein
MQMLRKLRKHAGIAALTVAVMALFVALTGIAGALPGKNTVNSGDVKENSLKGADIDESTLTLPSSTSLKVAQRTATLGPIPSGQIGDTVASCLGNEKAVGGGFAVQSTDRGRIDGSRPEVNAQGTPTGWHVFVGNNTGGTVQYQVYVLCAS